MNPQRIRLQKFLQQAGVASRRKSEQFIVDGRVRVNKSIIRELGTTVDPIVDHVYVDGELLEQAERALYIFHKPRNVITTLSDPQGRPSVGDYIKEIPFSVFPIGRLDFDVSGLLLLTNDGDFAQSYAHPSFMTERTYIAYVEGKLHRDEISELLHGIELEGERVQVCNVRRLENELEIRKLLGEPLSGTSAVELTVNEGRKHFVKKIFATIGHPVVRLSRTSFGNYKLGSLKPGQLKKASFPPK